MPSAEQVKLAGINKYAHAISKTRREVESAVLAADKLAEFDSKNRLSRAILYVQKRKAVKNLRGAARRADESATRAETYDLAKGLWFNERYIHNRLGIDMTEVYIAGRMGELVVNLKGTVVKSDDGESMEVKDGMVGSKYFQECPVVANEIFERFVPVARELDRDARKIARF